MEIVTSKLKKFEKFCVTIQQNCWSNTKKMNETSNKQAKFHSTSLKKWVIEVKKLLRRHKKLSSKHKKMCFDNKKIDLKTQKFVFRERKKWSKDEKFY